MENEVPGVLRPKGGTKKFRRNCQIVAEEGAVAVTDRNGRTTRFSLDGTASAPAQMITYLGRDPFVIIDGQGRALISSPSILWDSNERADLCERAHISFIADSGSGDPPALREDGVILEESVWLRRYAKSAPYVLGAGVVLAPIGRAFSLPVWLMLPFLPWILLYPAVRAMGYFAPRRIGADDIAFQKAAAERAGKEGPQTTEGEVSPP